MKTSPMQWSVIKQGFPEDFANKKNSLFDPFEANSLVEA